MNAMTHDLMSEASAAEYLGVPVARLRKWRQRGQGPDHARVGRTVWYRRADIDDWITKRMEKPNGSGSEKDYEE